MDDVAAPSSSAPNANAAKKLPRQLRCVLSLDDFEDAARRFLPKPIFAYVSGGCETNRSLRANRSAFEDYAWVPRVLVDTAARTLATPLLGHRYAAPFGIAPMGISALSAYRGDLVQAQAAAAANVPMILSGTSLIPMEDVARANPHAWFQAYVPGEPERILKLLDRVERAGFGTLVVTVDTPVSGNRENNIRAGFSTPLRPGLRLALDGITHPGWLCKTALRTLLWHGMPHFENSQASRGAPILSSSVMRDFGARDHLNWEHLALIRKRWTGQLVVKGILDPRDALLAREQGADGIIVSNHGGRQLDGAASPMRMLPKVVEALGDGDYPVMIDSGFRRGNDVLLALALGAKFVFVGRPFNYAGAVAGEAGVRHAIDILASEIMRNMALIGARSPSGVSRSQLVEQKP
ncbi:alpha-hydroxy acid oxidase [Variovorax sp. YR216]|uniref:alpha-hydroxy acid oxidase n=1 Tax=Variovorax sp. YR216 TaxID=1882828 RepID=UPI000B822C37|nr:alpha-hydroxy acid oxidase [Variovorax sp. YR216]